MINVFLHFSVVVVFSNWIVWFMRSTNNKIWCDSLNSWLWTSYHTNFYIDECQIVGSLLLLSSNSKKTRSGFTTLSLLNHAGKTSFFNKLSRVSFKDFVVTKETMKESIRPRVVAAIKNFPLYEIFFWTNSFNTENLWRALNYEDFIPNRRG